jgi:hypothetical protein
VDDEEASLFILTESASPPVPSVSMPCGGISLVSLQMDKNQVNGTTTLKVGLHTQSMRRRSNIPLVCLRPRTLPEPLCMIEGCPVHLSSLEDKCYINPCYLRIQSVPQREHHTSPLQRCSWLMLFKEIIPVYSENYTKPIYASSSSSSYGSTTQIGPWPPLLGFRNNNLFTGLDC